MIDRMTRNYVIVVQLLCWVIFGVMGRDLYIDCNNMCGNSSNHVNVSCTVKDISKMPWSNQEETAPKASFTSKNWFLHRNSVGDLVIGLNVSWEQPAVMFARHVDGYALIMTSSTTQSGSTKWEVMTSMPQVMAAKFVKVHFNYHCFDATYFIRSGRSYFINLYPMPMYEEGNEVISDMINIDVPDCSNMEMSQSTHCLDYDDDNGFYDVYYDDEDFDSSAMGKEETSSESNKSIQIAVPTSIFVLLCLCVVGGVFWWKRRPIPVKGSIFIFCDPSTSAAPLTSILATLLKLYAKRTVECNIWRQTVPNTLEWSRNAALAADQIIVIDGEPPFQINHGQTYLATFQPNELGKYKFPFTKRYLLMRDFKTFFKDFAATSCPDARRRALETAINEWSQGNSPGGSKGNSLDSLIANKCENNFSRDSGISSGDPSTNNPSSEYLGTDYPTTSNPSSEYLGTDYPTTNNPSSEYLGTDYPTTNNPSSEYLGTDYPTTNNPSSEYLGTDYPTTNNPSSEYLGTDYPTTSNHGNHHSNIQHPTT